jgi:serine/threonine protein kinase
MFMRAVLISVKRLHECGVLHRDIKFDNYGFEGAMGGGSGYLFDFGTAAFLTDHIHLDATWLCGTEVFNPPEVATLEQFQRHITESLGCRHLAPEDIDIVLQDIESRFYDCSCTPDQWAADNTGRKRYIGTGRDMWSVGAMLLELVTRRRAFRATAAESVAATGVGGAGPAPSLHIPMSQLAGWTTEHVKPDIIRPGGNAPPTVSYTGLNEKEWTQGVIQQLTKRKNYVLVDKLKNDAVNSILIRKVLEVIEMCCVFFQQDRASAHTCLQAAGISTTDIPKPSTAPDCECSARWTLATAIAATTKHRQIRAEGAAGGGDCGGGGDGGRGGGGGSARGGGGAGGGGATHQRARPRTGHRTYNEDGGSGAVVGDSGGGIVAGSTDSD